MYCVVHNSNTNYRMSGVNRDMQQLSIQNIDTNFAGRVGTDDYDESKLFHIHRKNRPFVWTHEMCECLLDSILRSYDVPNIICSTKTVGDREMQYILDGGNRITAIRKILRQEIRKITPEERIKILRYKITVVFLSNMTEKDERESFRRAARGVKPSDGQLYKMSETDSLLVKTAVMILEDRTFVHRALMTKVMFDTTPTENGESRDTKAQVNLANVVALISGLMNGADFITKSFDRQHRWIDDAAYTMDTNILYRKIHDILSIFKEADEHVITVQTLNFKGKGLKKPDIMTCLDRAGVQYFKNQTKEVLIERAQASPSAMNELVAFANSAGIVFKVPNASIKKRRLNSGDLMGIMVYDYHVMPYAEMKAKWVRFIRIHDENPKSIKETILTLSGAQNTTANSLAKKSKRIAIYLAENRIATEEELANVTYPRNDSSEDVDSTDEDRDEESDTVDEADENDEESDTGEDEADENDE
jgi:hypothetical protein